MELLPNLFSHARSELSQDAVLCYWLAWAHQKFEKSHPEENAAALKLLERLTARPMVKVHDIAIHSQAQGIDVGVGINDDYFLVIEDKTFTSEHGAQVERYRQVAKSFLDPSKKPWGSSRVLTAYVKTGNGELGEAPSDNQAVVLRRKDLLSILTECQVADPVLAQFQDHLSQWEQETNSYLREMVRADGAPWNRAGQEGFYMGLQSVFDPSGWKYVSNAQGGFMCFYWGWRWYGSSRCELYLQINNSRELQIRVGGAKDDEGKSVRASSGLRHHLLGMLNDVLAKGDWTLRLHKSGKYRPGWTGAIANVSFGQGPGFLEVDTSGRLDFDAVVRNLREVEAFVDAAVG